MVRAQLAGSGSPPPPRGFQGSNSGFQAWWGKLHSLQSYLARPSWSPSFKTPKAPCQRPFLVLINYQLLILFFCVSTLALPNSNSWEIINILFTRRRLGWRTCNYFEACLHGKKKSSNRYFKRLKSTFKSKLENKNVVGQLHRVGINFFFKKTYI